MVTGGPTDPDLLSQAQSIKFRRMIDAETGKIVQIQLIDTGLTTIDGKSIFVEGVGSTGGGLNVIVVSKTIGEITFAGSGLNDMVNGGEFTGLINTTFLIEIDLAAATDTFKWSIDGGTTWEEENVPITGSPQTLQNDITITFNVTTGHTLTETWTFACLAADPAAIRKPVTQIESRSPAASVTLTSTIFDARNIREAVITIECTFDILATLGMTVDLYASHDGINFDLEPWVQDLEPTFVAGVTTSTRLSHNLDALPRYFRAVAVNLDPAKGIGSVIINITAVETV